MKRFRAVAVAAVMGNASLAMGEYPPTTSAPAGYPPTVQAQQQSQPASNYGQPRQAMRVQVFPFEPVASPNGLDWVGSGLQQSLQTDVSHTGALLVIAGAALPPHTTPLEAAKASYATLFVTGTYQVQGDAVRADGQLIDVATGQSVGGFSARAPLNSIFQLEDAMGTQLQRLLPQDRPAPPIAGAYDYTGTPMALPSTTERQPSITVVDDPTPSYVDQSPTNVYYNGVSSYPSYNGLYDGGDYGGYPYVGYYSPFAFGFYGGIGSYRGYGYGHRYGYGQGYGGRNYSYGRGGYASGRGFVGGSAAVNFRSSSYGFGYGRSYGGLTHTGVVGGFRSTGGFGSGGFHGGGNAFHGSGAFHGGGSFHGGGGFGGGGHGGGGGGHR